ncbi:DUF3427 domain-containing protein [Haematomicrobium sanguinis]|uniref:DUF3427 domain-containing protein n=1 Tax=Haematomicrobium sanguinis TaxID=479106 RepID=UPI00047C044F|nr:DEAD/DEAH box helicase [Haematomicrobium sanguinis]
MTSGLEKLIQADTKFGFLDGSTHAEQVYHPVLISNEDENTMLWAIRHELRRSNTFIFSVAFITPDALALLKQALLDYSGTGTIVTSTYLDFNSPDMFQELLELKNVTVWVHEDPNRGFHPKGYLFHQSASTTAIVGSSNLTSKALLRNQEWNLRFSALPGGDIVTQIKRAIQKQIEKSNSLTPNWIDAYRLHYQTNARLMGSRRAFSTGISGLDDVSPLETITDELSERHFIAPNQMQADALEEIQKVRDQGERRAVVISATGTGKTILSALDVRKADLGKLLFVVHREQILDKAIVAYKDVLNAPLDHFGKFVGATREIDKKYVFATVQTLTQTGTLEGIDPATFDYIIIDEVHRSGAESYRRLMDHFEPKFMLGLTATPERTDGFNIYELFDYNVPYEIRLQAALEAEMLVPFHYFGVTDYVDAHGETVGETADLARLSSGGRIDHIISAIQKYGQPGKVKGLIFCSRNDEAAELSHLLNERVVHGNQLRTKNLNGGDSIEVRESVVAELERGELDYILTVDIFNEGIDVPSINQIVMLRQTQSSIIFTQQLGRGLRRARGKDHLRVIDFIGNYANNYLIPIALLGDSSLSRDVIRQKLIKVDDTGAIAGLSSVNFDQISRERVLKSLASVKLDSLKNLKAAFTDLRNRLNRPPTLLDFARFDTVDPVVMATAKDNYWSLTVAFKSENDLPGTIESGLLTMLSSELLNGKRPHELLLLRYLIDNGSIGSAEIIELFKKFGCNYDAATVASAERLLTLEFFTSAERKKFGDRPWAVREGPQLKLNPRVSDLYRESQLFRDHVDDVVETGLHLARHRGSWSGELRLGDRYSRKDVCRMLNWQTNQYSTIYGYKVDLVSQTCPIFVTYHKGEDVSESTKYPDELLDTSTMQWYTRTPRVLASDEIQPIANNSVKIHLFAKKDDAEGVEFNYLGRARSRNPEQTTMRKQGSEVNVVTMKLDLASPMEESLFHYLVSEAAQSQTTV